MTTHFATDHRGGYRRKLLRLGEKLAGGLPLADALEQTPGCLSPEQTLAARFGAHLGMLPRSFAMMISDSGTARTQITSRVNHAVGYFVGVILILAFIAAFLLVEIVPKFLTIFSEFAMSAPPALQRLASAGGFVTQFWYLFAAAMLALGWLFYSEKGWRLLHNEWLPWLSSSANKFRGADVLDLLALAEQAGRPLAGAMSVLARHHYDRRIRGQLLFVRNEIEQGAEVWQSMVQAKLLAPAEAYAITQAPDATTRVWSIQQLAVVRRQAVSRRLETMANILHPLCILLLAAGVLLVALGVLSPLLDMIQTLA